VLEAVVQDQEVRVELFADEPAAPGALRVHHHGGLGMLAGQEQGLVPGLLGQGPGRHQEGIGLGPGAVAPGQQGGAQSALPGPGQEPAGQGRLARAAPADVAHGHRGRGRGPDRQQAALVEFPAQGHDPGVQAAQGVEHGPQGLLYPEEPLHGLKKGRPRAGPPLWIGYSRD